MAGNAANVAKIEAYIGQSGSGKGVSIRRRLADLAPARLLIYDPRSEYADLAPAMKLPDLAKGFLSSAGKPFKARYVPTGRIPLRDEFDILCRVAFEAGDLVLLADELAEVTTPSWAPAAWRVCCSQGRHKALHIIGAAQRPAQIDKTFLGNTTLVRVGSLGFDDDVRVMAACMRAPVPLVAGLQALELPGGGARMEMLERNRKAGTFELVRLVVNRSGKTTEERQPVVLDPLRGGAGHVNAKPFPSPRRGAKTERVSP